MVDTYDMHILQFYCYYTLDVIRKYIDVESYGYLRNGVINGLLNIVVEQYPLHILSPNIFVVN